MFLFNSGLSLPPSLTPALYVCLCVYKFTYTSCLRASFMLRWGGEHFSFFLFSHTRSHAQSNFNFDLKQWQWMLPKEMLTCSRKLITKKSPGSSHLRWHPKQNFTNNMYATVGNFNRTMRWLWLRYLWGTHFSISVCLSNPICIVLCFLCVHAKEKFLQWPFYKKTLKFKSQNQPSPLCVCPHEMCRFIFGGANILSQHRIEN